jgi:hypothetical protein
MRQVLWSSWLKQPNVRDGGGGVDSRDLLVGQLQANNMQALGKVVFGGC